MSWTDQRVALLRKLWGEGKTAAEIAKELGSVTRNAVIGKAHRLKLASRASPIQQNNRKPVVAANNSSPTAPKKVAVKQKEKESAFNVPLEVLVTQDKSKSVAKASHEKAEYSLAELTNSQCRWPTGDPREEAFGFCGGEALVGIPYCEEHGKAAYQTSTRNRVLKAEDFENTNNKNRAAQDEEMLDSLSASA